MDPDLMAPVAAHPLFSESRESDILSSRAISQSAAENPARQVTWRASPSFPGGDHWLRLRDEPWDASGNFAWRRQISQYYRFRTQF